MKESTNKYPEIESLEQLRDELRVQAHLFKAEIKDEWKKVEKDWQKIKGQLGPVKWATEESAKEVKVATKFLLHRIAESYQRIKKSLPL